jgi:hypothetical protein
MATMSLRFCLMMQNAINSRCPFQQSKPFLQQGSLATHPTTRKPRGGAPGTLGISEKWGLGHVRDFRKS